MNTATEPPLVISRASPPVSGCLSGRQYREMRLRARTLGVSPAAITACQTMGELKPLVRRRFLRLAKRWHPDMAAQRTGRGYHAAGLKGTSFRRMSALYAWFKAQPDTLQLVHPVTVPDDPLPWALCWKEIPLPAGFHEDRSWLAWR